MSGLILSLEHKKSLNIVIKAFDYIKPALIKVLETRYW